MAITNVSTFGSLQTLLQNMGSVQGALNTAQGQLSSGNKSQTFDGISSSVQQLTSTNAQLTDLASYQAGNSSIVSQMNVTSTILGQVNTLAANIKSLIATQTSGVANSTSFTQQLNTDMSSLVSLLNTTYGGNYLFGGTDLSIPPVKTTVPFPVTVGQLDSNYYQGTAQSPTFTISSNATITPGVRADDTAFQSLFAGIRQALNAVSGANTSISGLQSAENLVDQGMQGVTNLQANVNTNILTVQQQNTQDQSVQTYLQNIVSTISSTDEVAVSTQVAQDTSILQASFAAFARISQLNLAQYLNG